MSNVLFELNEQFYLTGFDAYGFESNQPLKLTVGKTYRVLWGDSEWNDLTAYDAGAVLPGTVYLGNGTNFGLPGNNEPFIIASDGSGVMILSLTDQTPVQRKVVVYGEAEKTGNVLADLFQDQANAIREGLGPIGLIKPADFPARTLDIVKLINSGDSTGEGSGGLVVTSGSFTADSETATISHNLGVVPDVFGIFGAISGKADTDMPTDAMALVASVGMSQRLLDEHQVKKAGGNFVSGNMMLLSSTGTSTGFDGDDDFMGRLHNATATTIDVGCAGTNGKLFVGKLYSWFAIGRKS